MSTRKPTRPTPTPRYRVAAYRAPDVLDFQTGKWVATCRSKPFARLVCKLLNAQPRRTK